MYSLNPWQYQIKLAQEIQSGRNYACVGGRYCKYVSLDVWVRDRRALEAEGWCAVSHSDAGVDLRKDR